MRAEEIEQSITFEEYAIDHVSDSVLFKSTLTVEYFGRASKSVSNSPEIRGAMLRDGRENIMRKLYDDQRESLYKAVYDLRAVNPMDFESLRKAQDALLSAALRQQ